MVSKCPELSNEEACKYFVMTSVIWNRQIYGIQMLCDHKGHTHFVSNERICLIQISLSDQRISGIPWNFSISIQSAFEYSESCLAVILCFFLYPVLCSFAIPSGLFFSKWNWNFDWAWLTKGRKEISDFNAQVAGIVHWMLKKALWLSYWLQ